MLVAAACTALLWPLNNFLGPEGDTVTVDEQLLNTEYWPTWLPNVWYHFYNSISSVSSCNDSHTHCSHAGVRSEPGAARTILRFHTISARPSK
jgi:hypothetical protein